MEKSLVIPTIVAEDEDLIRNSLIKKLSSDPAIRVMGAAQDGKEALEMIHQFQPDLLLTDIRMPIMDGIELIRNVDKYYPRIRIVITSGYSDFEYARQAILYNVVDYLLKPISASELAGTLARLKAEFDHPSYGQNMKGAFQQGATPEEIVAKVQSYMRDNFSKELSLEKIAANFNFNPSYLSKIFVKHTGEPPSKFLITLRINEAKYLLIHNRGLSVKEVGEQVGYADPYYFSRIFKQVTGQTPTEFQK
jgi:two-component system response regulator YesN